MAKDKNVIFAFNKLEQCKNCIFFSTYYFKKSTLFVSANKGFCHNCGKEKSIGDICEHFSALDLTKKNDADYKLIIKSLKEIQTNLQEIMLQSECKLLEKNHDN